MIVTPFFTLVGVCMRGGGFYIRAKYADCDCFHVYRMYAQDFRVFDSDAITYQTMINLKVGAIYRLQVCSRSTRKWYAFAAQINDRG